MYYVHVNDAETQEISIGALSPEVSSVFSVFWPRLMFFIYYLTAVSVQLDN